MTIRLALLVVGAAVLGIAADALGADPPVRVEDPWVADAPPVARVRAGYLTIENLSGSEQVLLGAQSPLFDRVEIHRTEVRDGIARMTAVERLPIPPGQKVALEPGGYHLMLLEPRAPLTSGGVVPITLEWAGGQRVEVQAPVRSPTDSQAPPGHDHSHHQH